MTLLSRLLISLAILTLIAIGVALLPLCMLSGLIASACRREHDWWSM